MPSLARPLFLGAVLAALGACSDHSAELESMRREAPGDKPAAAAATPPAPLATPTQPPATVPPARQFSQVMTIDLGDLMPGDAITFDLPGNVVGFNVSVEYPGGTWAAIERIESPSGIVHDQFRPVGANHSLLDTTHPIGAASVPMGESVAGAPLEAGPWTITVAGEGNTSQPMKAVVRAQTTTDGVFHGGELDLNVYVPEGLLIANPSPQHAISAANADKDPDIAARVDKFYALAKQLLGVDRGKVTFFPAPKDVLSVTSDAAFNLARSASSGQPDQQALQLTLTNELSIQGLQAWGVAPGLPGAAGRAGTALSNVTLRVTSTAGTPNAVEGDAVTMMHESGHFFGLEHPTEFDGSTDGLSDTPSCPGISPTTPNPSCPDLSNVMFAAGDFSPTPVVSPMQKAIVLGSPVFRALVNAPAHARALPPSSSPQEAKVARMAFTRSGRALSPVEHWLSRSFCGHSKLDVRAFAAARGRASVEADLRAIAQDADLPDFMRTNATVFLGRL